MPVTQYMEVKGELNAHVEVLTDLCVLLTTIDDFGSVHNHILNYAFSPEPFTLTL